MEQRKLFRYPTQILYLYAMNCSLNSQYQHWKCLSFDYLKANQPYYEHSVKGGPRFPKVHALCLIATNLQAHMSAVRPEMTIWGVKGLPPPFFWLIL